MLKQSIILWALILVLSAICSAESYFGHDEVKFFEEKEGTTTEAEKSQEEGLWTEPVIGPSGEVFYYTPPKPVLDFVNNPTEENAKAYLDWNKKRFDAYAKAQQVLKEVIKEQEGKAPSVKTAPKKEARKSKSLAFSSKQPAPSLTKSIKARLLYFIDPDCKYCRQELPIINAFYEKHKKELQIEGITGADNIPELNAKFAFPVRKDRGEIKDFKISTYPTMIFFLPGGKVFGIKGVAQKEVLEKIWKENKH